MTVTYEAISPDTIPEREPAVADIFLSYAREDDRKIRALARVLESFGWTVFWDRRLRAGQSWRDHIEEQITTAKCILVIWSLASVESDFVIEEAEEGKNLGTLIPVLLHDVQIPRGFRQIHAADLTHWDDREPAEGLDALIDAIRSKVPPRAKRKAKRASASHVGAAQPDGRSRNSSAEAGPTLEPTEGYAGSTSSLDPSRSIEDLLEQAYSWRDSSEGMVYVLKNTAILRQALSEGDFFRMLVALNLREPGTPAWILSMMFAAARLESDRRDWQAILKKFRSDPSGFS